MCIIAIKPFIQMPDNKTIENMWYNNPDGRVSCIHKWIGPNKRGT